MRSHLPAELQVPEEPRTPNGTHANADLAAKCCQSTPQWPHSQAINIEYEAVEAYAGSIATSAEGKMGSLVPAQLTIRLAASSALGRMSPTLPVESPVLRGLERLSPERFIGCSLHPQN